MNPKIREKKEKSLRRRFTKSFIYRLEKILRRSGMRTRVIYAHYPINKGMQKHISYSFAYGHKDSIRLFHILYDGVDKNMYLERKHDKFIAGFRLNRANG